MLIEQKKQGGREGGREGVGGTPLAISFPL